MIESAKLKRDNRIEKTSNDEHDWIPINSVKVLYHNRTQTQSQNLLLKILPSYYQLPILGTLDMSHHFHQKR